MAVGKSEFRVTTWPAGRLPHPPLTRHAYELVDDALVPTRLASEREDIVVETAGEIYLKLRALDLDDRNAVLAFVQEYGVMGIRRHEFALVPRLAGGVSRAVRAAQTALTKAQRTSAPLVIDGRDVWRDDSAAVLVETLPEFELGASLIHDLTNLWLIASGRPSDVDHWFVLPQQTDPVLAADQLESAVTPALAPFAPRVMVSSRFKAAGAAGAAEDARGAAQVRWAHVPLYATCALELFNHIAEEAEYRRCGNDTCRRLFVRQEGRAKQGQHRTEGVRFCSDRCKSQQGMRNLRARRASERHLQKERR